MHSFQHSHARPLQRGSALVSALTVVTVFTGISVAMLVSSLAFEREAGSLIDRARALQLAECGLSEGLVTTATALAAGDPMRSVIGDAAQPLRRSGGRYWASVTDRGDGTFLVTSTGSVGLIQRRLEAIAVARKGVFDYAIFSGNSSGDPNFVMGLGGTGSQADSVLGDVYTGGDLDVTGDATITGQTDAGGTITGTAGTENVRRTGPDLQAMNYESFNDVDVAANFAAATPGSMSGSGTALQLPESDPAHIFRLNPDDRTTETTATVKNDYFLEDPYEPTDGFTLPSGQTGHNVTLSGTMGAPGVNGNDKVYFIDGNLWIHNRPFGRLRLMNSDPDDARVTFVVKGNIYFSDDVLLEDEVNDGVAFIALTDENVADSGNVYLGDPRYGTLDEMHAYLYAENNFYDNNIQGDPNGFVSIKGTMSAGNHVAIASDWTDGSGNDQHTRLTVEADQRLATGALSLPGIPGHARGDTGLRVVAWREVSAR